MLGENLATENSLRLLYALALAEEQIDEDYLGRNTRRNTNPRNRRVWRKTKMFH
jgi:hypothetical protein